MAIYVAQTQGQVFALLVEQYNAYMIAAGAQPAKTTKGSHLWGIFNAIALATVQQQIQIGVALMVARLATSSGADVDSFVNAFGIYRVGAQSASGGLLLSTGSPLTQQGIVPFGWTAQSPTTGYVYTLLPDASNPASSNALGGYIINSGAQTVTATATCSTLGAAGNAPAGTITQPTGSVSGPGIVSVTNPLGFTNGSDQETDTQLKNRFVLAMSTGRVATGNAIAAAILSVSPGLLYSVGDRVDQYGAPKPAFVTVVVNSPNATGSPTADLLAAVQSVVAVTRAFGIGFQVIGPTILPVATTGTVVLGVSQNTDGTANPALTVANANAAIETYLEDLGLDPQGNPTQASLGQAYAAAINVPGVVDVQNLTLNATEGNIVAPFATQIIAGNMGLVAA